MIQRETIVTQSIEVYAKAVMASRGYLPPEVEYRDAFPGDQLRELTHTIIASGFNFDDDGVQAELGSDLKTRIYSIEFFVFGTTDTWARNVANALKFGLDAEGTIPLLDVELDPPAEFDRLQVLGTSAHRQVVPDPAPWQQFVWLTTLRAEDTYFAALT